MVAAITAQPCGALDGSPGIFADIGPSAASSNSSQTVFSLHATVYHLRVFSCTYQCPSASHHELLTAIENSKDSGKALTNPQGGTGNASAQAKTREAWGS